MKYSACQAVGPAHPGFEGWSEGQAEKALKPAKASKPDKSDKPGNGPKIPLNDG